MKAILLEHISDLNRLFGHRNHGHPLISVIDLTRAGSQVEAGTRISANFYCVMFKNYCLNKLRYGRNYFDFQEGSLICMAPHQVITMEEEVDSREDKMGWGVFFHPDFILGTELGTKIRDYTFFGYEMTEALHLSDKEKAVLWDGVQRISAELGENTDRYSQTLLISNLELLLNYCNRFYDRQFLTRRPFHQDMLTRFEMELDKFFRHSEKSPQGLPSVRYFARHLGVSPDYLSDLLKRETGWNTREFLHRYLIKEAKQRLLHSNDSISEIAYGLGFEYPQYFSRLFKTKTGMTPMEFRQLN